MKFKKLHRWTVEEEKIIKNHFHDMPFSSHGGSRFDYLREVLKKNGVDVKGITPKSISRKTYRLGLKSVDIQEDTHDLTCGGCGCQITRPKRYKRGLCDTCTERTRHVPKDASRYRAYQRQYQKAYRRKNNET